MDNSVEMCQTCYDFDCRRFNVLVLDDFKLIDERGGAITCSFVGKYDHFKWIIKWSPGRSIKINQQSKHGFWVELQI
jgi:hypothetical protein